MSTWSWFDDENKQLHPYEFQTIFDILSFAENLPLRVMDYDALDQINIAELWYLDKEHNAETPIILKTQTEDFCQHVRNLFSNIENIQTDYVKELDKTTSWQNEDLLNKTFENKFKKLCDDNKNKIKIPAFDALKKDKKGIATLSALEEKVWLNRPSNTLPIHSLFRHCEEWRWWVLFWFFCEKEKLAEIANKAQEDRFSNQAFFISAWEFHIQWLELDNKKYLLIVGPIYKEQGLNYTTKKFYTEYGQILKRCYKAFYTCYTQESLTYLSHDDIIRRMVHARSPISKTQVIKRVYSIKSILTMLKSGLNTASSYSYNDIYNITYGLISLERMINRMSESELDFNLGTYKFDFSFSHNSKSNTLQITILFDKDEKKERNEKIICLNISDHNKQNLVKNPSFLINITGNIDSNKKSVAITKFNKKIEYWNEIYQTRRKAAQEIYMVLLGEWLQNHYGALDKTDFSQKNERFYNYICHNILDWVRADLCNLYRFDHVTQKIILIGQHKRQADEQYSDDNERRSMSRTTTDDINDLTTEQKQQSAVFRSLANSRNIFIEQSNPKNPAVYTKLKSSDDSYPRSVIVVPITFQGRIYGALEVIGFRNYQFQLNHQLILTNVAHLIANYIYSQQMLLALQEITRSALQSVGVFGVNKNMNRAYTPLCKQLSKIFLSQCTNLWVRGTHDDSNAYILSGTTHFNEFENCETKIDISQESEYVASYLIAEYNKYLVENPTQYPTRKQTVLVGRVDMRVNSGYNESEQRYIIGKNSPETKLRRVIINELNSKELVVFLLTDKKEILGFVTLLNPKFYDFGDNWENIISLVREQLVIALHTLNSEESSRVNDQAILMHEIKQDTLTLYRRACRLEKDLKTFNAHLLQVDLKQDEKEFKSQWQKMNPNERDNFVERFSQLLPTVQQLSITWKDRFQKTLRRQYQSAESLEYKLKLYELNKSIRLDVLYGKAAPDFNDMPALIDMDQKCSEIKQDRQAVAQKKGCFIDISDVVDKHYYIKIQFSMLNTFIVNLIDNSVKYANPDTAIILRFFKTESSSYRLQIENASAPLYAEEKGVDLFKPGVRTEQARRQDSTGDGMGLYIVACICDFYAIRYDYDKEKALQGRYIFNFDFPMSMVTTKSGYR